MSIEELQRETIPDPFSASGRAAELALRLAVETPSVLRMRQEAGSTREYIAALLQQEREELSGMWGTLPVNELRIVESQLQEFDDIAV